MTPELKLQGLELVSKNAQTGFRFGRIATTIVFRSGLAFTANLPANQKQMIFMTRPQ